MDGAWFALRCGANTHGCDTGFRLGFRLHDLLVTRQVEGQAWIVAYVDRGRFDVKWNKKIEGFYQAGHRALSLHHFTLFIITFSSSPPVLNLEHIS